MFQLSSVVGPALGGALIALFKTHSNHPAVFIYLISFSTALTCFCTVKMIRSQQAKKVGEPMTFKSLATGFNFVFSQRLILGLITLDMFAVFLGGATSLLPVFAKDILHSGADGLGLLQAALPFGSVLCALYLAHRPPLQKAGRALLWCVVVFGLATILFGLCNQYSLGQWFGFAPPAATWFWLAFAMLFVCGFADNISVVVRQSLIQLLTPDALRGRVTAVNQIFIGTSNEAGALRAGLMGALVGPVNAVLIGGACTISVVLLVARGVPALRRVPALHTLHPE
jgi:MFS family permease